MTQPKPQPKPQAVSVAFPGRLTASTATRTIGGIGIRYGVYGRTSAGRLRVDDPAALTYADHVILTREHDRSDPRGVLASRHQEPDGSTRVAFKVADGPAGDDALREASDGTRAGLSFDIVDAHIEGGVIKAGHVIAFGQVAIPAYDTTRVDSVAASTTTQKGTSMTPEQAARLLELQNKKKDGELSEEEANELKALEAMVAVYGAPTTGEPAPAPAAPAAEPQAATAGVHIHLGNGVTGQQVAASIPAVPGGVPTPATSSTTTKPKKNAWQEFVETVTASASGGAAAITAALADITHAQHGDIIEQPAWSGELWSGVEYEPVWSDLFSTGDLTNWKGEGWRFKTKIEIKDYAGNKVAIPTSIPETEASGYESARMATGHDIDRKYFDFRNQANTAFLARLGEQARESWAIKLDGKVRAFTLANAVDVEGPAGSEGTTALAASDSLIRAAALAVRALRRRRVLTRSGSTWVMVNDDDLFSLMDYNALTVPEFLQLYGIDPKNFRSSQDVPAGQVIAGARQTATVRTLPGSPLRFDAQHLANGGVDEAFFGYWAIEEHHTAGIARAYYADAA